MITPKSILVTIVSLFIFNTSYCQLKEIIDKDISLITYLPYDKFPFPNKRKNKRYMRKNHEYHEILALDTLALPYLLDKISDTTQTSIRIPCAVHELKIGDVAFALLNDIVFIPFHLVTGSQWDSYGCDSLPDGGWDYLYQDREKFQKELKIFFASTKGKMWVRLLKAKLTKIEKDDLLKSLYDR